MRLDEADRGRVAAAVTAAETHTDAEVAVIAAERSDEYRDVALHWTVLAMLLLVAVQAAVPGHFGRLVELVAGDRWDAEVSPADLLTLSLILLAIVLLLVRLATSAAGTRVMLAPRATLGRRVRRRAILLFRASIEGRTAKGNGVLLYLSLAERRAEIVADAAVTARVPAEDWGAAMTMLVAEIKAGRPGDGLVAAIGRIGDVLAEHFPRTGNDPNEIPDRLIEL